MSPKKGKLKFNSSENSSVNNNNNNNNNNTSSVAAFAQTVHPITKARCVNCHGSFQQPLHAVDDAQQAHDSLMTAGKINMNNPGQSRMVLKLENENHNCWSNCAADATEMENAIVAWKGMINNNNNNNNNDPNRTADSPPLITILDPNNSMDNGTIVMDAESGSLVTPMVTGNDNGEDYIWVPNGNGGNLQNNNPAAGIGYLNFNSTISDNYKVYGLVDAPNGGDNSFHIKIDNGQYYEWHITETEGFEWRELTDTSNQNQVNIFIPAGNGHILEIRQREDGTKISNVVVTNDPNVDLNTVSNAVIGTLTYDLTSMLNQNIQFQIDVQEYDEFSYKFFNPRMVLNGFSVNVKNIRIYINGDWNPQHSTYTIVDKLATPADPVLSPYSMIVLKDQGPQFDIVGFSFEVLTIQ